MNKQKCIGASCVATCLIGGGTAWYLCSDTHEPNLENNADPHVKNDAPVYDDVNNIPEPQPPVPTEPKPTNDQASKPNQSNPTTNVQKNKPDQEKAPESKSVANPKPSSDNEDGHGGVFRGLTEGSIGTKYKQYLNLDENSHRWSGRLNIWKRDLGYRENRQTAQRNPNLPDDWKYNSKNKDPDKQTLMNKCMNAYRQNQWDFNQTTKTLNGKNQYWNYVWNLCNNGTSENFPNGWGTN